jgi:hypothetical protein
MGSPVVDDFGRVIPDGSPSPDEPELQAPESHCPTCTGTAPPTEERKGGTYSTQTTAQVGILILGYAVADDLTSHLIIGVSSPGLGLAAVQCYTTGDEGIDGGGWGLAGGVPFAAGLGPVASWGTDGKNTTVCAGVGAGDLNGASYAVTMAISSPFGPSGNPGDTYVPASMNPDGSIAPARVVPQSPSAATEPAAVRAPAASVPANANFSYGNPGEAYVPAAMNPDGSVTRGYSVPRGN